MTSARPPSRAAVSRVSHRQFDALFAVVLAQKLVQADVALVQGVGIGGQRDQHRQPASQPKRFALAHGQAQRQVL